MDTGSGSRKELQCRGQEEKELASGRGDFSSSAEPATSRSHAVASGQLLSMQLGLICVFACQIAMTGVSFAAQLQQQAEVCPSLLMDFECARYQQRLKLAGSEAQRGQVVADYVQIQNERRRVCPVSDKVLQQAVAQQAARLRSVQRR